MSHFIDILLVLLLLLSLSSVVFATGLLAVSSSWSHKQCGVWVLSCVLGIESNSDTDWLLPQVLYHDFQAGQIVAQRFGG